MQKYADINNDSGVDSFEINDSSITVWFKGTSRSYTYSYSSAGEYHVETMKKCALWNSPDLTDTQLLFA